MVRYIFLDDAATTEKRTNEQLGPLVDNVIYWRQGELQIIPVYPYEFDEQISFLRHEEFDGLILDLRLDQFAPPPGDNGTERGRPNYRATAFAQELRTRSTEGNLPEFPIVLWSYEKKLQKSFAKDDTGHDLFDLKCKKETLQEMDGARDVAAKLIALSEGYDAILEARNRKRGPGPQFYKFLGFDDDPGFLDPRILGYFEGRDLPLPAHEYARFLIRQLLEVPGPLIDDEVLAARIGVDIEASEDWEELKQQLPISSKYSGPFHEGWPRWWTYEVEAWWESLAGGQEPLRRVDAESRVQVIRDVLDIDDLVPASPVEEHYSTQYWTVCQGSGTSPKDPLDPLDGFMADRKDKQPWQDELYISERRAVERARFEDGLRVDPLEKARLEALKKRTQT